MQYDGVIYDYHYNEDGKQDAKNIYNCPINIVEIPDSVVSINNSQKFPTNKSVIFNQYKRITVHITDMKILNSIVIVFSK